MSVYGYTRVSTLDQAADDKSSLDAQRLSIEAAAREAGLHVAEIYDEPGISGTVAFGERPVGRVLYARLVAGDTLIVAKLDRAFRNAADALATADRLKKDNVDLVVAQFGAQPVTANGTAKLFFGMMALVAEFERGVIVERITTGKRAKKKRGGFPGGLPSYGWRVEGKGREAQLVEDPEEQQIIARLRVLASRGFSLRDIARILHDDGIRGRSGFMDKTQIKRILDRAPDLSVSLK